VTLFPPICPHCHSASGRMVIPDSPEVETYQCQACHHVWSQPALHVQTGASPQPRRWWDRIAERLNRTKESDPQ
jgi:hypothetical protein